MIQSFGNSDTHKIWLQDYVRGYPESLQRKVFRKLRFIDSAVRLDDLKIPPSNRLEKMKGKWKDFYSIRVNDQYRIWFRWDSGHAYDVEFGDYHDRL